MQFPQSRFRPLPFAYRVLGILFVGLFVLIGIAGLILPIIPGLVFLLLAAYLLTRVSRRAATYANGQPWIARHLRRLETASSLTICQRLKLGLLLVARGLVDGMKRVKGFLQS